VNDELWRPRRTRQSPNAVGRPGRKLLAPTWDRLPSIALAPSSPVSFATATLVSSYNRPIQARLAAVAVGGGGYGIPAISDELMEAHMRTITYGIAAGILVGTGALAVTADETAIKPPPGSALLLELVADGVQIYACEAKEGSFLWSFKGPEANLFNQQGRQIGTHFSGPIWKLDDGSAVAGEVIAKADAPEPGAIQPLLLRAKSHEGSGTLSAAAYIRRTETKGGVAPKMGCDATHLSDQARMRYSATYQFFSVGKE
jgi:hypothetical protein